MAEEQIQLERELYQKVIKYLSHCPASELRIFEETKFANKARDYVRTFLNIREETCNLYLNITLARIRNEGRQNFELIVKRSYAARGDNGDLLLRDDNNQNVLHEIYENAKKRAAEYNAQQKLEKLRQSVSGLEKILQNKKSS